MTKKKAKVRSLWYIQRDILRTHELHINVGPWRRVWMVFVLEASRKPKDAEPHWVLLHRRVW